MTTSEGGEPPDDEPETNEQIGGFIVIEARDLNEAIQVASRIPPARFGGVEVRPIRTLTYTSSDRQS